MIAGIAPWCLVLSAGLGLEAAHNEGSRDTKSKDKETSRNKLKGSSDPAGQGFGVCLTAEYGTRRSWRTCLFRREIRYELDCDGRAASQWS
jgi:hypothetical protein